MSLKIRWKWNWCTTINTELSFTIKQIESEQLNGKITVKTLSFAFAKICVISHESLCASYMRSMFFLPCACRLEVKDRWVLCVRYTISCYITNYKFLVHYNLFALNSHRMFSLLIVLCITHLPMVCFNSHFFYLSGEVLFLIFFKGPFSGAYFWRGVYIRRGLSMEGN